MSVTVKNWQLKPSPWKPEEKTLADVPEGVRCVVTFRGHGDQFVRIRRGEMAANTLGEVCHNASTYYVLHVLDESPAQQPKTLADVPPGRCVLDGEEDVIWHDTDGGVWWTNESGLLGYLKSEQLMESEITEVLDIVAELVEVTV